MHEEELTEQVAIFLQLAVLLPNYCTRWLQETLERLVALSHLQQALTSFSTSKIHFPFSLYQHRTPFSQKLADAWTHLSLGRRR